MFWIKFYGNYRKITSLFRCYLRKAENVDNKRKVEKTLNKYRTSPKSLLIIFFNYTSDFFLEIKYQPVVLRPPWSS